jgi:cytochrome P450
MEVSRTEKAIVRMDDPEHGIHRRMVNDFFKISNINRMQPDIEHIVRDLVDDISVVRARSS